MFPIVLFALYLGAGLWLLCPPLESQPVAVEEVAIAAVEEAAEPQPDWAKMTCKALRSTLAQRHICCRIQDGSKRRMMRKAEMVETLLSLA